MPKKSKIAVDVGISANALDAAKRSRSLLVDQAMSDAVAQASFDGVTDPAEVKARMLAARAEVLAQAGYPEKHQVD